MKFLLLIFLTTIGHAPGDTWLELGKTADFRQNHPGKKETQVNPGSPRLDYLKKQKATLAEIISGEPALFPIVYPEPEWLVHFMIAHMNLQELVRFHASQQNWDEVFSLIELTTLMRKTILASEPNTIWFLISGSYAQTTYDCVSEIRQIKDRDQRVATLQRLRKYWLKLQIKPKDFLLAEKGETKFARHIAKDFKGFLKSLSLDLDTIPIGWKKDFAHQLTTRQLLEFPLDPAATRQEILADLKAQFASIRSGQTRESEVKLKAAPPVRDLSFFRKHPNGLFEIYKAGAESFRLQGLCERRITNNLIHEIAWLWLLAEADNQPIDRPRDIISLLSAAQKKEYVRRKIEIHLDNDTIKAPPGEFWGMEVETIVKVPDPILN